ncbi:hypothetical protein [Streptomyces sp. NPDC058011]
MDVAVVTYSPPLALAVAAIALKADHRKVHADPARHPLITENASLQTYF